ncbi:tRNA (adenine-N1)-methyltransferase [Methanomethylovorans sp.]|uniref:tRNA (adenine-N1)-methyltransferase n=1 Tax=Methanomethylovorans sp. TaxID=2758717 RepID=UPI00351C537E
MENGEMVLLRTFLNEKPREFIVCVSEDAFHSDFGVIELAELARLSPGDTICSHRGQEFIVQKPRMPDMFRHAQRSGAPMMPKDIGMVIAYTGICKNDVVLDAGTGSGILSMYLGSIAKKVITYEIKENFANLARSNISKAGLDNVEVRCGNIVEAIDKIEEKFDVVTLDTINSPEVIPKIRKVLVPGGFVVTYSPFIEQTIAIRKAMDASGPWDVTTIECIERPLSVSERGTRPATGGVGHTGYITIARI